MLLQPRTTPHMIKNEATFKVKFSEYLGKNVAVLLQDAPFAEWQVERNEEDELDEPIIHYEFSGRGLELRCDGEEIISAIFVFVEDFPRRHENICGIHFNWPRNHVLAYLGEPAAHGKSTTHPILGKFGPWDRMEWDAFAVRIEYTVNMDRIVKLTYMRSDVIPK
jgi:hypothetical protein